MLDSLLNEGEGRRLSRRLRETSSEFTTGVIQAANLGALYKAPLIDIIAKGKESISWSVEKTRATTFVAFQRNKKYATKVLTHESKVAFGAVDLRVHTHTRARARSVEEVVHREPRLSN